jgi:hypothetical protein
MQGMVRIIVGLLIVMGAVGTIDADPSAPLAATVLVSVIGFAIAAWGVSAMKSK